MLKQFIADASHELNTPLSIFQARADVLEKKLRRSNSDVEHVQIMNSATERMAKIVQESGTFSRNRRHSNKLC
ncbi:MAG: histidine kinase dimerization/phospho-acceptor domain-containing protein [Candidatus Saccharibacteria bacterium]